MKKIKTELKQVRIDYTLFKINFIIFNYIKLISFKINFIQTHIKYLLY